MPQITPPITNEFYQGGGDGSKPTFGYHWPPCPKCGTHETSNIDKRGAFLVRGIRCPVCEMIFNVTQSPYILNGVWELRLNDNCNNEFLIQKDTFYGRRYLLWVNIKGCGFWFMLGGAYWFLKNAKKEVKHFTSFHKDLLANECYLAPQRITWVAGEPT